MAKGSNQRSNKEAKKPKKDKKDKKGSPAATTTAGFEVQGKKL